MSLLKIRPAFSNFSSALMFLLFSLVLFASPFLLNLAPRIREEIFRFPQTENADLQFWRQHLYVEKSDLDWVFIGPCTVWWHIHPKQIESEVLNQTGAKIRALTLGYNHFSPEVSRLLVKELLKNRRVKNIVLPTPRYNDSDLFPHPDSHYWWLYGEDFPLLKGLSLNDHFRLYSATVVGSIRNLATVFQTRRFVRPTRLTDDWGMLIRPSKPEQSIKSRDLKVRPAAFISVNLPESSIVDKPLSETHRQLFVETVRFIQSKGVRVWLLSSPLKDDFEKSEIQERENWPKIFNPSVSIIGIAPKWIREVYSEEEISRFFEGENLTDASSQVWSRWVAQAIGSTYAQ